MSSANNIRRKVLLIGWDAADWKIIEPLLDAGKMPSLERLRKGGVWGRLATLRPILSPMLWTSIATGMRPFQHGVLGFSEPDPDSGRVRPISSTSRKVKAVWNILHQNGLQSNVIGWWPSHPAEPIHGVMVSNHYQRAMTPADKPWPMQPGTVHPQRLAEPLRKLRLHPAELAAEHLLPFVPKAADIDQSRDKRLEAIARTLADCTTVQAAATALMQLEPWDFMAVYFDAIDHFGHGFMKYHPPRQPHIPERDFELYQGVMEAGYRYHDMMLGTLLELAGPDTTVILMSDHGFHCDHRRPARFPFEPAGPAIEHSPYGILVIRGPGIKTAERVYGASLLDITPTILTLFGLPMGQDMLGKPLVEAFETEPQVQSVESWQRTEGDCGMHPPDHRVDPEEARQSLQQLIDLGYIDDPGDDAESAVKQTVRELQYNLAQAYIDDNRYGQARTVLEDLWQDWPDELRFANLLMICYRSLGEVEPMERLVDQMLATRCRLAEAARQRLKELQDKVQEERKKRQAAADADPSDAQAGTKAADKQPILTPPEQRDLERCRAQANPGRLVEPYLRGLVALARGDLESAAQLLLQVAAGKPESVDMHLTLGEIFVELKHWTEARDAFRFALEIDPERARAFYGLGRCCLAEQRNLDAVDHLLDAVGLGYHFPQAHYHLGIALHRTNRLHEAVRAFQVSLSQNPHNAAAHDRLAHIHGNRFRDLPQALHHREEAQRIRAERRRASHSPTETEPSAVIARDEQPGELASFRWPIETFIPNHPRPRRAPEKLITIVSGLPRSGTSMIMQMLAAGGLTPLVDGNRTADEDNPRGYYEYELAKQLITNKSWLPEAEGKVVKLIAQLVPHLPLGRSYRIIFLRRDIEEILRSQRRMLDRMGRAGADLDEKRLAASFSRQLAQVHRWLSQHRIPRLVVSYNEAIADASHSARQIADFLGGDLNVEAMAAAVDRSLYRQHAGHAG